MSNETEYEIVKITFFPRAELLEFLAGKRESVTADLKYVARRVK